jgi:hypothetical protein
MFPNLTQKHMKLKFRAEEVKNGSKITMYLRNRQKAPPELRLRILQGVSAKRELEDSRYVNRKPESEPLSTPVGSPTVKKTEDTGLPLNTNFSDTPGLLGVQAELETTPNSPTIVQHTQPIPETEPLQKKMELPDLRRGTSTIAPNIVLKPRRRRKPEMPNTAETAEEMNPSTSN